MTTQKPKRKLTAILSADAKGYSRLMREDEVATVETLKAYRELMASLIKQHRGRVVDSPGDNVLAEFASVVNAVECAVEIQEQLKGRNAELPENRRMEFRIGINLGDVIEEGKRIYGDGVNVSARVEGLAEGGGICISGTVYEHVKDKLVLGFESLGAHAVKNIPDPVRVYRVLVEPEAAGKVIGEKRPLLSRRQWVALAIVPVILTAVAVWYFVFHPSYPPVEPASIERMAYPLPDKPSIAVLPFVNMSGDPEQEYFSDGITEEIINGLSKIPYMFVIARHSAFSYKGKPVKVQQVAEELGVRYVMEGSVRIVGDRVRVTAQLIDATTGHHLWSERYDRVLEDIFAIQDDITANIMQAMQLKVAGLAWLQDRPTPKLEAFLKLMKGIEHFYRYTKDDMALARKLFEEAIALDPGYGPPHRALGYTHHSDAVFGWSDSPGESLEKAEELAQKALSLDDEDNIAYLLLSLIYRNKGQFDKAVAVGEKALALNPNNAETNSVFAFILSTVGRHQEAIAMIKKAIRLNPHHPPHYLDLLGEILGRAGRYEEAIAADEELLQLLPDYIWGHINLTAWYSLFGREEEASEAAKEVLRIDPKFSIEKYAIDIQYENQEDKKRYLDALRKAGLPDKPPLPLPEKPSIAVLPFENMSGDPEQEYFSDGITEEIITALSKIPKLFVIARNSTFTYKGKPVKVQQVSRDLGVRYVLEGSVRKAEDKVRITAQLVDATTGNHLWAERYDRDLKDIFAIQDEITIKVITALRVQVTEGEQAAFRIKSVTNLDAYLKYLEAREYATDFNRDTNIKARKAAEEAIALDPGFQGGYSVLAQVELFDIWLRLSKSPKESCMRAIRLAKKAIAIEDSPEPHRTLAGVYVLLRKWDEAIAEGKKAIELDPNSANAHGSLGHVLVFADIPQEAIRILERAIRLNPYPPSRYFHNLALAYKNLGKYEEAISAAKKALRIQPNDFAAHIALVSSYSLLGRDGEARAQASELLKIHPEYCIPPGQGPP